MIGSYPVILALLRNKTYPIRFEKQANILTKDPGLLNYSIVGRNANTKQRKQYVEYDLANSDRINIAKEFNINFSKEYNVAHQLQEKLD